MAESDISDVVERAHNGLTKDQIESVQAMLAMQLFEHDPMCGSEICEKTAQRIAPFVAEFTLELFKGQGASIQQIAEIIDPSSFCDIPFTDDPALLDVVERSKQEALRKARAIRSLAIEEGEA
jgi:hypothetical protein